MSLTAITIFCDDIRFEQHGKLTLVGLYGNEMHIYNDYPIMLPKFGAFVQIRMSPNDVKEGEISIFVYTPSSDEPVTNRIPVITPIEPIPERSEDFEPIWIANVPILLNSVILTKDGYIKVRISYHGDIYKSGAIKVIRKTLDGSTSSITP